jgi:hypothetical protein
VLHGKINTEKKTTANNICKNLFILIPLMVLTFFPLNRAAGRYIFSAVIIFAKKPPIRIAVFLSALVT